MQPGPLITLAANSTKAEKPFTPQYLHVADQSDDAPERVEKGPELVQPPAPQRSSHFSSKVAEVDTTDGPRDGGQANLTPESVLSPFPHVGSNSNRGSEKAAFSMVPARDYNHLCDVATEGVYLANDGDYGEGLYCKSSLAAF
ncbi:hypothetical protein PG995_005338 [Apiospora arundinis]